MIFAFLKVSLHVTILISRCTRPASTYFSIQGFTVEGLGFSVQGLGFRAKGLGFEFCIMGNYLG